MPVKPGVSTRTVSRSLIIAAVLTIPYFGLTGTAWSQDNNSENSQGVSKPGSESQLLKTYHRLKPRLSQNPLDAPIVMQSDVSQNRAQGDVYAILQHPYETLRQHLSVSRNWCQAMILHVNIKSCVKQHQNNLLKTYLGNKMYQDPEDSLELDYHFSVQQSNGQFTHILLQSDYGPYGTSKYRLHARLIPLDNTTSFIHFSYSLKYGKLARLVIDTYLSTFGRNKVGFTVTNSDPDNPEYIKGIQGVVERNAMRYFLAIQSYFDGLKQPKEKQFETNLNRWFGFTEKYRRQLYELDRIDYLNYKQQEYEKQQELQRKQDRKAKQKQSLDDF